MKMGIKEFRERIAEVASGDEPVIVTHHGRRVGRFVPEGARGAPADVDLDEWVREREEFGRRWRARTPDWRDKLKAFGIAADEIAQLEEMDTAADGHKRAGSLQSGAGDAARPGTSSARRAPGDDRSKRR